MAVEAAVALDHARHVAHMGEHKDVALHGHAVVHRRQPVLVQGLPAAHPQRPQLLGGGQGGVRVRVRELPNKVLRNGTAGESAMGQNERARMGEG